MKFILPKMNRRNVIVMIGVIIVAVILIVLAINYSTPQAVPQNIATVRRGDLSASVNATGKVSSKKTARLSTPMGGIVQSINKVEGDEVKPGDVILSLRADDTVRRMRQAELNVQVRQLDLARAKSAPRDEDIEIARQNLRKATLSVAAAEDAYNKNPTTQNDAYRESARADLEIARASFNRLTSGPTQQDLDALQGAITSAQLDLDAARNALAQTQITAPFTGTVTEVNIRVSELTGGYNQLVAIADLRQLQIAADIDEIDVANVAVGQAVEVRLDAFPGEMLNGKITRLFPAASSQRGTTVYSAIIEFDPQNLQVRLGMGANLKVLTVDKKNVLIVPNRALKNVGTRKAVHVVAPGEPRDVIVEIGVTNGSETEIISGLNEGDRVNLQ